jgi:glucokinase
MMGFTIKNFNETMLKTKFSSYVMGIDIGGTNTNLAIAGIQNKRPILLFSLNFKSKELSSLSPAIKETINYAKEKQGIDIDNACIGASGVVSTSKDYAELTNVEWNVNIKDILEKTTLKTAHIINDFQTIGYGINLIDYREKNDILPVKEGYHDETATKAIIGAGTGLGKSILTYDKNLNAYIPHPSEGGHSDFPAQNNFELELIDFIKKIRNITKQISYEELISGRGIESIYYFLQKQQKYEPTQYTKEINKTLDKPVLISKYKNLDETCKETFQLFTKFYARCAKNFVLDSLAKGGLYIAGGIAIKNQDIFTSKNFIEEFENSHKRENILKQTPIYLITNYDISLYGACFAAMHKNPNKNKIKQPI